MNRSTLVTTIALFLLSAAVVGGILLLLATRPEPVHITINPPAPTSAPPPTGTPAPVEVYVTGAVNQPGALVMLAAGSRVDDAVQAAGGASPEADLDRINLAAALRDGDHVHVYAVGETAQAIDSAGISPDGAGGVVHINRATQAELESLPGIGPALAQRIIAYREANGAFTSLQSLTEVSGIGDRTVEALEGLVAFD